ncbi:MAG: hypothetical protein PHX60_07190 [Giesbergeria sp.]|uniref:CAP domain-containing protein n=1 Tax=Giesbergeria sp. TaxID=2818473 RepID=UPI0026297B9B|nr:hypothetical protein [Giesbergeria sp.]MDD2609471.1 hypothetical protein [Giesbergeria sp.]
MLKLNNRKLPLLTLLSALAWTNATASYTLWPEIISISKKEWTTETDNAKFFLSIIKTQANGGYGVNILPPKSNLATACIFSNPNVLKFSTETPPTDDTGLVIIDTNEARKLPRGANELTLTCDSWIANRGRNGYGPVEVNPTKITAKFTIHNTYPDLTRAVARIDDSNRSAVKLNITRPQSDVSTSRGVNYWIAALVPGHIFGVAEDQLFFLTKNAGGGNEWKQLTSEDALSVVYLKNQSAANHADEIPVNFGFTKEEMASLNAIILTAYQIDGQEIKILDYVWNPAVATPVAGNYTSIHKLYAYETVNKVREIMGLSYGKPVAALNSAAQSHADYLEINNVVTHLQTQGMPGFTGVYPRDRARAFDPRYAGGVSEAISAKKSVWSLLGIPYHATAFIDLTPDFGFGFSSKGLVVNAGLNPPVTPDINESAVIAYPCNNIKVDVKHQGYETPNPSVLNGKKDFGYSSIARVKFGQKLTVDSWELRDANNNLINTVVMTKDNDANQLLWDGVATLIPINPLPVVATSYTSVLRGRNNGVPFEKVCTWRTVGEGEIAEN